MKDERFRIGQSGRPEKEEKKEGEVVANDEFQRKEIKRRQFLEWLALSALGLGDIGWINDPDNPAPVSTPVPARTKTPTNTIVPRPSAIPERAYQQTAVTISTEEEEILTKYLVPENRLPIDTFHQGLNVGWVVAPDGGIVLSGWPLDEFIRSGAGEVRIEFMLGPSGVWDAGSLDPYREVIKTLGDRGIRVIGLLDYSSMWGDKAARNVNSAEVNGGDGRNEYITRFVEKAVAPVVAWFGPQLAGLQIWNEQNMLPEHPYAIYPSCYAQLLSATHDEVKRVCPGLPVLTGGFFANDGNDGVDWFKKLHKVGEKYAGWRLSIPYDGVGYHPYIDPGVVTTEAKLYRWLLAMRVAMNRYAGGYKRPIVITEAGWQSHLWGQNLRSEAVQAENVGQLYRFGRNYRTALNLGPIHWFNLYDWSSNPDDGRWGLLASEMKSYSGDSRKLSWYAYRLYAST